MAAATYYTPLCEHSHCMAGGILDQVPRTITWKKLLYVAVDGGGGGEEVSTPEIKQLSLVQCMGVHACAHCWPN